MRQQAFAFLIAVVIAVCSLVAPPVNTGAEAAQNPSPILSTSTCTTADLNPIVSVYGFDSPNYKASPENLPAGVRSYLAGLLTGRLYSCAALAGQTAAKSACTPNGGQRNPKELWDQLEFCQGILGLGPQAQPLLAAQEPTFYVLLAVGAGPGGSPGGTQPKTTTGSSGGGGGGGGKGGSGPATGSTATGSSVDNPAYFLLFVIAQHLERDVCARSNISKENCDSQHTVAVVPESTWNLEDFQAQCIDDPYVPNDPNNPYGAAGQTTPAGHGTLGAIVINGSTVTADGTFAVVTVYGSSEANYAAQVVTCNSGGPPNLSTVWSANISDGNKTTALSFFPIALAGTLLESNAAAHEAVNPAPNASASPNSANTYISYQNDVALGIFAANTMSLTLGNPSSGLTFRHTFEGWATKLSTGLNAFCRYHSTQNLCRALKLPSLD